MNCYQSRLKYSVLKAAQEKLAFGNYFCEEFALFLCNSFSTASHSTSIFYGLGVKTKLLHPCWEILTVSSVS